MLQSNLAQQHVRASRHWQPDGKVKVFKVTLGCLSQQVCFTPQQHWIIWTRISCQHSLWLISRSNLVVF